MFTACLRKLSDKLFVKHCDKRISRVDKNSIQYIIVSDDAKNFYDNIISAYIAFQNGNYANAIKFLKCIEVIFKS